MAVQFYKNFRICHSGGMVTENFRLHQALARGARVPHVLSKKES